MNSNPVPTEEDIVVAERHLKELKEARERARKMALASVESIDDIPALLTGDQLIKLMRAIQSRLQAGHRKVRGSRVPSELKHNLEVALKDGEFTLAQLEKIFNLSVSYISKVKHDLGLTKTNNRGQEALAGN